MSLVGGCDSGSQLRFDAGKGRADMNRWRQTTLFCPDESGPSLQAFSSQH